MKKRLEDKIYKTQIQISLEIDTLSVIERFKEQYKENGRDYSSGEIIEILLIQSPNKHGRNQHQLLELLQVRNLEYRQAGY